MCGGPRLAGTAAIALRPLAECLVGAALIAAVLALGACTGPSVTEDSASAVTVRYDGVVHRLEGATALAQQACARHGKVAKLRRIAYDGLGAGERFAHFDCI